MFWTTNLSNFASVLTFRRNYFVFVSGDDDGPVKKYIKNNNNKWGAGASMCWIVPHCAVVGNRIWTGPQSYVLSDISVQSISVCYSSVVRMLYCSFKYFPRMSRNVCLCPVLTIYWDLTGLLHSTVEWRDETTDGNRSKRLKGEKQVKKKLWIQESRRCSANIAERGGPIDGNPHKLGRAHSPKVGFSICRLRQRRIRMFVRPPRMGNGSTIKSMHPTCGQLLIQHPWSHNHKPNVLWCLRSFFRLIRHFLPPGRDEKGHVSPWWRLSRKKKKLSKLYLKMTRFVVGDRVEVMEDLLVICFCWRIDNS